MEHMSTEFEMSLVSELTYFLGLRVRKSSSDTFVSQVKYAKNLGNKFKIDTTKHRRNLIWTHERLPEMKLVMVLVTPSIVWEFMQGTKHFPKKASSSHQEDH